MPDRPRLPPRPTAAAFVELEPIALPQNVHIAFNRTESVLIISPEVMQARVYEAQSMSQQAQYQFAVPAEERTKQVRHIGLVVVIVALACVTGCVLKPEASGSIAAIAGIVSAVFGGIYAIDLLKKPPPRP